MTRTTLAMGDYNKGNKLSILTFNTLGTPFFAPDITKRYRKTAQLINEGDFDIVCLQELFTYYHVFLFKKYLTNFPYVIYQKTPFGPKGGLIIFSKLPLSDSHFITYSLPSSARIPFHTRIAQNGMLTCVIKSLSVRIATTHLTSDIEHDLSTKNRYYELIRSQSHEAAKTANKYTKNGELFILTGDFNIAQGSQLYQEFLQKSNLYDVFYHSHEPTYLPNRISYIYPATSANHIDNIFISSLNKLTPLTKEYLFSEQATFLNNEKGYLSDHIALHCILEINKTN